MEGFHNHGKDISLDMVDPPVKDLVPRGKYPLGKKDIFDFSLILAQPQGKGGGARVGNPEKIEEGRNIHLPGGISENTFTEVEDHIRRVFLQPVDDGMDFLMDGKDQAFVPAGTDGILY